MKNTINLLSFITITFFITSCSTPIHLHQGDKKNLKNLALLFAAGEAKIVTIDGIAAKNTSVLGDQEFYIKPGNHHFTLRPTKFLRDTQTICIITKPNQQYIFDALYSRGFRSWVPSITESELGHIGYNRPQAKRC